MTNLLNKERRKKKPFPWKVDLQVGPDIRLNFTGYIQVRRERRENSKGAKMSLFVALLNFRAFF
jgi:hypothetical protein